jgi:hypothetical protein
MITPGPIGAGTRFREHARLLDGTEIVAVEEIIVFEASKRMVISIADRPHRNFDEFTFDPVASATRVTHRYDYEYPFSAAALGGWFQVHTRQDSLRAAREAGQIRIKQILESDAH